MRDMDYKTYALMGILLASVTFVGTEAYAQSGALTVETDNASYTGSEAITISGNVGAFKEGQPVLLKVTNPSGAIYRFDQIPAESIASDGSYTYDLVVGGKLGVTGTYTVTVNYGSAEQETTFDYTASETGGVGGWKTIKVTIEGEQHDVQYQISGSGNSLDSMTGNVDTTSVTGMLTAASDGTLMLRFDRATFDAVTPAGEDDEFVAFADDVEAIVDDMTAGTAQRTISIDFEAGTEEVEIVGTFIVPEFGAIAAIVLAVAIVGIIAVTARNNKFSFLPKQ